MNSEENLEKTHNWSTIASIIMWDRGRAAKRIERGVYPEANRGLEFYEDCVPQLCDLIKNLENRFTPPIRVLDVGCGTGRAMAELEEKYGDRVEITGITLKRYPPMMKGYKALAPEKVRIRHAGKLGFKEDSFHLVFAIGSLDTTNTISSGGEEILKVVAPGGYFIFVETTNISQTPLEETQKLINYAQQEGFTHTGFQNKERCYTSIFEKSFSYK